ncbi:hypothetical protein ACJIZ3_005174 [Penstemon smallii]|uniref:Uncharacterized protein n=1 Tax=Penstemon smallii TaxID=265156 RepID=A0ABD3S473_9LAMI
MQLGLKSTLYIIGPPYSNVSIAFEDRKQLLLGPTILGAKSLALLGVNAVGFGRVYMKKLTRPNTCGLPIFLNRTRVVIFINRPVRVEWVRAGGGRVGGLNGNNVIKS